MEKYPEEKGEKDNQNNQDRSPLVKSRQTIRRVNNLSFINPTAKQNEKLASLGIQGDSINININLSQTDNSIPLKDRSTQQATQVLKTENSTRLGPGEVLVTETFAKDNTNMGANSSQATPSNLGEHA